MVGALKHQPASYSLVIGFLSNFAFSHMVLSLLEIKRALISLKVPKFVHLFNCNSIQAFKFYASKRRYFDKLVEISFLPLARDGGSESGFSLSSTIVGFILQKDGIHKARDTYKRYVLWKWNQCWVLFAIICCMSFPILYSS